MLSGRKQNVCPLPTKVLSLSWAAQSCRELSSARLTCDPAACCRHGLLRVQSPSPRCHHGPLSAGQCLPASIFLCPLIPQPLSLPGLCAAWCGRNVVVHKVTSGQVSSPLIAPSIRIPLTFHSLSLEPFLCKHQLSCWPHFEGFPGPQRSKEPAELHPFSVCGLTFSDLQMDAYGWRATPQLSGVTASPTE